MNKRTPKLLSVMNYKGGVGKTTLVANLAAEFASLGKKVLMVDVDSQASLTFSFLKPQSFVSAQKDKKTIKSWFDSFLKKESLVDLNDLIFKCHPRVNNGSLDIIISSFDLIDIDLDLAIGLGGYPKYLELFVEFEKSLLNLDYDLVIIDCPPNFNLVTRAAIVASKRIIIPARPDFYSGWGIQSLTHHIKKLEENLRTGPIYSPDFKIETLGIVFTMVEIYKDKPISQQANAMSVIQQHVPTLPVWINSAPSIFISASQPGELPLVLTNTKSGTTNDKIKQQFKAIANHVLKSI